jgi:ubiquitin C-terminal hydrolase
VCIGSTASLEPFWSIAVDLDPEAKIITLKDALDCFFAEEKIEGVYNDTTKQESRIGKRVEIQHAPQVLLLHLKRFMFDGAAAHKTRTRVEFPETLSLQEYSSKGASAAAAAGMGGGAGAGGAASAPPASAGTSLQYELIGVVSHHGTKLHSGHYTASIRLPTGEWCKLDDDNVSGVDISDVLSEEQVTAYVLIYELSKGRKVRENVTDEEDDGGTVED